MSPTRTAHRPIGRSARAAIAIGSLVAAGFGIGAIGAGTAFAQTTHHAQARALAAPKARVSKHERRETTAVRASETVSTDPTSTDPNEPTDPTSTDPSTGDEGTSDTSVTDSNDTTDLSSIDQSSIVQTHRHH